MASMDKLVKALDALKLTLSSPSVEEKLNREKISHCLAVTEFLCSPEVRSDQNYSSLLSFSIETFLQICGDNDSNIRMMADECLNRIIRANMSTMCNTILKIYMELHKEIKKNREAKSLRAALTRFAHLAHMIRPQKGKAYMQSLTPCLVKIAQRNEEIIFETLAVSVPKIFLALGPFASDSQIKTLLETLLVNVESDNTVIRRTSAKCIAHICLTIPKSQVFFSFVLSSLLDMVIPITEETSSSTILGVLNCIRELLPHINYDERQSVMRGSFGTKRKHMSHNPPSLDYLFQIFELCMEWTRSTDHNIVTTSLETLHQVLSSAPACFINQLVSNQAPSRLRIHPHHHVVQPRLHKRSLSEMSLASSIGGGDEMFLFEQDEAPTVSLSTWLSDQQVDKVPPARSSSADQPAQHHSRPSSTTPSNSTLSLDSANLDHSIPSILEESGVSDDSATRLWRDDPKPISPELSELIVTETTTPPASPAPHRPLTDKQWDIGELFDGESSALLYAARFLVTRFLLVGGPVRVVVRCPAVSCLTQIIKIQPSLFFATLDRHIPLHHTDDVGRISDVLRLSDYQDHHLRGLIRLMCGQLLASSLYHSAQPSPQIVSILPCIMLLLIEGLTDESSVCVCHSLSSVSLFLKDLLHSDYHSSLLPLLEILHKIYHNPYWLVKVKLLELLSEIPLSCVAYSLGDTSYQDKTINSILLPALDIPDSRIRKAAATAFVKLVENLHYPIDHLEGDIIVALSSNVVEQLLLPDPNRTNHITSAKILNNLSRIVFLLSLKMMESTSKYTIYGCVEALCMLSTKYRVIEYPSAWQCSVNPSSTSNSIYSGGLLSLTTTLLTESNLSLDLECHTSLLVLAGNLFYGLSQSFLRHADTVYDPSSLWPNIKDPKVCSDGKALLQHTLRLLSMLVRMVDESPKAPGVSPLKRRQNTRAQSPPLKNSPFLDKEKREEKNKLVGHFQNIPHCVKLYDLIKSVYNNYRGTLEEDSSEKFLRLVIAVLDCLCDILKPATITSSSSLTEEILSYLRIVFVLQTTSTIRVVNQLLRCLFVRKTVTCEGIHEARDEVECGVFDTLFGKPLTNIACLLTKNQHSDNRCKEGESMESKQNVSALTLDRTALAIHIKLFEPIVIQSLREYTVSSNVHLQVEVLKLLMQLLQLKVNYCLLDSEQIFFQVVLKQFDFLETGQIQNAELLIPEIFQFLAHLSNEKNHSKQVISIPRVIQLCDGLMASGQDPLTHCIPALTPLVEHVFVYPIAGSDAKELETQCEVILAMLLKLVEYPQVISLLKSIMRYSGDQWKCLYRQTVDTLVTGMTRASIHLDRVHTMYTLLNSGPSSSPLNSLLMLLFTPRAEGQYIEDWLGGIAVVLMSVCGSKEECVLLQLDQMSLYIQEEGDDPLNVNTKSKQSQPQQLMAKLIVKVIKDVSSEMEMMASPNYLTTCSNPQLLYTHFADFIYTVIHMVGPGNFDELSKCLIQILKSSSHVEGITESLLKIHRKAPMPLILWAYLLAVNDMGSRQLWSNIMNPNWDKLSSARLDENNSESSLLKKKSINSELVRRTAILLYCEYIVLCDMDEKMNDLEWFLDSYIHDVITNCYEPPVDKMLQNIYLSESHSKILLDQLLKCIVLNEAGFTYRLLHCLEYINPSHSGLVLKHVALTLIQHSNVSIARLAVSFCSSTIEYLRTLEVEQASLQLPQAQILALLDLFSSNSKLSKRGSVVVNLLKKLGDQMYGILAEDISVPSVDSSEIQSTNLDSAWLVSLVRNKCCSLEELEARQCVSLLSRLEEHEIRDILYDPSFNLNVLNHCFHLTTLINTPPHLMDSREDKEVEIPHLYRLSRDLLFEKLLSLKTKKDDSDVERLVLILVGSVKNYLVSGCHVRISASDNSSNDSHHLFYSFALLSVQVLNGFVSADEKGRPGARPTRIASLLECLSLIFNLPNVTALLEYKDISFICDVLFSLIKSLTRLDVPMKALKSYPEESSDEDLRFADTCLKIACLTAWLETSAHSSSLIPTSIYSYLREVILRLSLSRKVVYYCRVPVEAWSLPLKSGTDPPPIDVNALHDISLVRHLTNRISMLRWRGRQEFEETWVCLLSALILNVDPTTLEQDSHCHVLQLNNLVVDAVTWLVLTTLRLDSCSCHRQTYLHVPRLSSDNIRQLSRWPRLKELNDLMLLKFNMMSQKLPLNLTRVDLRPNIERFDHTNYGIGQLSVAYLQCQILPAEERQDPPKSDMERLVLEREKQLLQSGIDVRSCVQSLMDLFSQWALTSSSGELDIVDMCVVRSTLCLSDLFSDKSHYVWMLDRFLQISRNHPQFDIVIHQYLTIGVCKAASVLSIQDEDVCEKVMKVVESSLKSSFAPLRTAGVDGLLYLLQVVQQPLSKSSSDIKTGGSSSNVSSDQPSDSTPSLLSHLQMQGSSSLDFSNNIIALALDHINNHFITNMESEEDDCLSVIALVVYMCECFRQSVGNIMDVFKALTNLIMNPPSHRIYQASIQGVERLALVFGSTEQISYSKLALESLSHSDPLITLPALQLLLASIYCGEEGSTSDETSWTMEKMETISILFDRIKKGYLIEVELIVEVVAKVLSDLFPASDILNKVIAEFLSPNQPHKRHMASIVLQCFSVACDEQQLPLLQDWVVHFLNNLSINLPTAGWCLCCFFISASTNPNLKAIFPVVQSRIAQSDIEDRKILCLAALDFYRQLSSKQKETFKETAMIQKGPFSDIITCLNAS